jgi:hypothetical protein
VYSAMHHSFFSCCQKSMAHDMVYESSRVVFFLFWRVLPRVAEIVWTVQGHVFFVISPFVL